MKVFFSKKNIKNVSSGLTKIKKDSIVRPVFSGKHTHTMCGPVAQLVEHLTFNQRVTGSNPVGLTIRPHKL